MSTQGDSSYFGKWSFDERDLSRKLPLLDLPEPLNEDLPRPDAPLDWPCGLEDWLRSGFDEDPLSRREEEADEVLLSFLKPEGW